MVRSSSAPKLLSRLSILALIVPFSVDSSFAFPVSFFHILLPPKLGEKLFAGGVAGPIACEPEEEEETDLLTISGASAGMDTDAEVDAVSGSWGADVGIKGPSSMDTDLADLLESVRGPRDGLELLLLGVPLLKDW